jgi:type II secretory pathway predicted ATPase ExeA
MPLNLKGVMAAHGIRQSDMCAAVTQTNGRPLSITALSLILNWDTWPTATPRDDLQRQIEDYLRTRGVPDSTLKSIWIEDKDDAHRGAHPKGVHVGQSPKHTTAPIDALEVEMLTSATRRAFGIFRDPFIDDVRGPDDLYLSPDQRYIREAMFQTARHGGFIAVVGESGAGKSVLRRDLIDRLQREEHPVNVVFPRSLDKSRLSTTAINESIIQDLAPGTKTPRSLEAQARLVEKLLLGSSRAGNVHVLLIEEAHDLTLATFKHLKRYYELEDGYRQLLGIILIGQPELRSKLDERQNWEAREVIQRVQVAELVSLSGAQGLRDYVQHKLARVSVPTDIIADDAYEAMAAFLSKRGGLYPLRVNNLTTRALNRAAELGVPKISADLIKAL